jgi:tetratricopeptide (TPR) repeat protein
MSIAHINQLESSMKKSRLLIGAMMALCAATSVNAANFCGELKNAFGPFDYRQAGSLSEQYRLVISAHFTPDVENNVKGSSSYLAADIDYTLRAWPNHPGALAAMSRQAAIEKTLTPNGAKWPVDCYFLRAFQFAPDDGAPHSVYGNHLLARGKDAQAMVEFKRAVELDPNNATISYNAGLAFFKAKDYDKALMHAHTAYAQDFPLRGLKNKLISVGKWVEPPAAAPATQTGDRADKAVEDSAASAPPASR